MWSNIWNWLKKYWKWILFFPVLICLFFVKSCLNRTKSSEIIEDVLEQETENDIKNIEDENAYLEQENVIIDNEMEKLKEKILELEKEEEELKTQVIPLIDSNTDFDELINKEKNDLEKIKEILDEMD